MSKAPAELPDECKQESNTFGYIFERMLQQQHRKLIGNWAGKQEFQLDTIIIQARFDQGLNQGSDNKKERWGWGSRDTQSKLMIQCEK